MKNSIYTGPLTMDERLFIHCYYTTLSRREMAEYLKIPLARVKLYLDKSNLRLTREQVAAKNSRIQALLNNSDQFDDFIKENYLNITKNEIARIIKKSGVFVDNRIKFLKLHIPDEIIRLRIESSWKKKGSVPPNKGKKLSAEMRAKLEPTFFKKGHTPLNAKKNGEEVLRKDSKGTIYIMIKVPEKSKLDYKHRILWEQHNGPIPKGFNVQFKDGNTLNCVIENLYLIRRSEQLIENSLKPEAVGKRFLKMNDEEIEFAKVHAPGLLEAKAAQIKLKTTLNKLRKNDRTTRN